jgi:hypothetical protein
MDELELDHQSFSQGCSKKKNRKDINALFIHTEEPILVLTDQVQLID